eukprot:Phypoly_transcript_17170.p1 GENE.Phypoly_transcript_17170~~Phypoly_transcript_17170.p1  ORF type:complete len:234 (+),score=33.20 Phypoly_transcript_17170:44-745(+)
MESEKDVPSCIIHETLAPPQSSLPASSLDLIHLAIDSHNTGQFQEALTNYDEARRSWITAAHELPPDGEMYFLIMQGNVFVSMRKPEEALQKFMIAKQYSDLRFSHQANHPVHALVLAFIATAYVHMLRFPDALVYFKKALRLRIQALGEKHVDTATLRNNVAVCMACSDPITASREDIVNNLKAAHDVLYAELGPNHPRTATALRNLSRESSRVVLKYSVTLPAVSKLTIAK